MLRFACSATTTPPTTCPIYCNSTNLFSCNNCTTRFCCINSAGTQCDWNDNEETCAELQSGPTTASPS